MRLWLTRSPSRGRPAGCPCSCRRVFGLCPGLPAAGGAPQSIPMHASTGMSGSKDVGVGWLGHGVCVASGSGSSQIIYRRVVPVRLSVHCPAMPFSRLSGMSPPPACFGCVLNEGPLGWLRALELPVCLPLAVMLTGRE